MVQVLSNTAFYETSASVICGNYMTSDSNEGRYDKYHDHKWIMFMKAHNLRYHSKDNLEKWYDLYLRLCAENMIGE